MKHTVNLKLPVVSKQNRELCLKILNASLSERELALESACIANIEDPAERLSRISALLLSFSESLHAAQTLAREHLAHATLLDENIEQHRKAAKFAAGPNPRMN